MGEPRRRGAVGFIDGGRSGARGEFADEGMEKPFGEFGGADGFGVEDRELDTERVAVAEEVIDLSELAIFFARLVGEDDPDGRFPSIGRADLGLPDSEELVGKVNGVEAKGAVERLDEELFGLVLGGFGDQGLAGGSEGLSSRDWIGEEEEEERKSGSDLISGRW